MNTQTTILSLSEIQQVSGGVEYFNKPNFAEPYQPPVDLSPSIRPVANREFIGPRNPYGASIEVAN
jgi:hypothetical protein